MLRVIPIVFALIAVCTTGGALAENESPPVRVAQTPDATPSGNDRPATLGDIRALRAETQALGRELRAEMTNMGRELRAQLQAINGTLHTAFLIMAGIFAAMIVALAGLLWKFRFGISAALICAPLLFASQLTNAAVFLEAISDPNKPDHPLAALLGLCVIIGVICYGGAYFFEKIKVPILPRVLRIIGNVLIGLIVVVSAVAGEIATV